MGKDGIEKNVLEEVMTFAEACKYVGKSPSYFNNLVKIGEIQEGIHYRTAGGCKLILKNVVEKYKG